MTHHPPLLMIAGIEGAVASTLTVAMAALGQGQSVIAASLTTADRFSQLGPRAEARVVGWDRQQAGIPAALARHGVLAAEIWSPYQSALAQVPIQRAPDTTQRLQAQVEKLSRDMAHFRELFPDHAPVLINLLPAAVNCDLDHCVDYESILAAGDGEALPDLAYVMAAVESGVAVVNFTPNRVEFPALLERACQQQVPVCGRDGKTGQTYLKVVLSSALKARALEVDGWYSTNILGNADGRNLQDPQRSAGKIENKTDLLDGILGYRVGQNYGEPAHTVRIDYYPPRGDAKEAWDVIDFKGLFGLPMSLRLNWQGRDSILAAPMVLDLARWAAALQLAGRSGAIAEMGFFFKKPMGQDPPLTFEAQLAALVRLERQCG